MKIPKLKDNEHFVSLLKISAERQKVGVEIPQDIINATHKTQAILRQIWETDFLYCERFYVMYLSSSNQIIGIYNSSDGSINSSVVCMRKIFAMALLCGASHIILAHNHPSGNLEPSKSDHDITRKIKEAAKTLDIVLLDHIILTEKEWLSFADEGYL